MKERFEYEERLRDLPMKEHIAELRQFFIDMMDWTQQSDEEEIYFLLEKSLDNLPKED